MKFWWASFCFVQVCMIHGQGNEATIQYYEKLITEEQQRANTYPLPVDCSEYKPKTNNIKVYGTFDYIIIGAGSAGAVIANRLSEDPSREVLLLEAGGHESNFSDIPRMNAFLQGLEYNWNYNVTTQKGACLSMLNKQCAYPRGKSLGGSSTINALMYVRGNKHDYDSWAKQGNPGWAYKDVLPYFKRSENSKIDGDAGYHGHDGNMHIEYPRPISPQAEIFLRANMELGHKIVDYNGREQLGAGRTQFNTLNGRRDSTGRAFLDPVTHRNNLNISINSLAVKILIGKFNRTAYGVLFAKNQQLYVAYAAKEIISSAGTIESPKLLMLSGIGHTNHLRSHGIPPIHPLPVGDNLQDHQTYHALHFVTNYTEPPQSLRQNIEDYLKGVGSFTYGGNAPVLGFYQTKYETTPGLPDIELIMVPANNTNPFLKKSFHYNDEAWNTIWAKIEPQHSFTIFVILLHPKSRGTVRLSSNNPYDYPAIDPRFLSDLAGNDIKRLHAGIEIAVNMVKNTREFQKINATLFYAPLEVCKKHEFGSPKFWYCQLRQLGAHIFHPIGTCKMGPNPQTSVVNHKLKVHGIKRLRVADASVIPTSTSGHTNAPAIMIGEKASDLIKNE